MAVARFEVLYRHLHGVTEERHGKPQGSLSLVRDSTAGLPQHEARALIFHLSATFGLL
jgi:hypothetical protein